MRQRTRTAESRAEFERVLDDYALMGWRIVRLEPYLAVVRRRTFGRLRRHLLLFLLFFWTFGLVNLGYALVARARADTVHVRLVQADGGWRLDGRPTPGPAGARARFYG